MGADDAIDLNGLASFQDAAQILGIEFPAVDDAFQGIHLDGILDGSPFGMGVRIAWKEGFQGCKGNGGKNCGDDDEKGGSSGQE